MINSPCWAVNCLADAKLASPKLAKQTSFILRGLTMTDVSAKLWASRNTLFPSSKVSTVADVIPFWRQATFVAMSGLECTAAYCRLPHKPLRALSSWLVMGLVVSVRRTFGMSIGEILWIYRPWFTFIEKSGNCSMSRPVNLNLLYSRVPKGRLFCNFSRAFSKFAFPPPKPSSTCVPRIPSSFWGSWGFLSKKRQLSKGCEVKPTSSSLFRNSR